MNALNDNLNERNLLRFITAGSVDDGKSTLIGRLLFDSKGIFADQLAAVSRAKHKRTVGDTIDLSLLTDGLEAEREQGITIDVAYRYFATPKRKFIIADTPGHEQYTRNMVTGASTADAVIILVDVSKVKLREDGGVDLLIQTKRHSTIAHLLQIEHVVVAVNKMDLVNYDQDVYDRIVKAYHEFAATLGIKDVKTIPLSALAGDNVVDASERMPWYQGPTLIELLEDLSVYDESHNSAFRFPVQLVARHNGHEANDFRGYMGRIEAGNVAVGDKLVVQPSGQSATVKEIVTFDGSLQSASAGQSVTIVLEEYVDVSRGDLLASSAQPASLLKQVNADVCWLSEEPLDLRRKYWIKHGTKQTAAKVTKIDSILDINTQQRHDADALKLNDVARIALTVQQPLAADAYSDIRIGISRQRLLHGQRNARHVVQLQRIRIVPLLGVDVKDRIDLRHFRSGLLGAVLDPVFAAQVQRLLGQPAHVGVHLLEQGGRLRAGGQQVAARHVHVLFQHDGDRLAGAGALQGAVEGDDFLDRRALAGRLHHQLVADGDVAGFDTAHVAAEVVGFMAIVACYQLYREAEGGVVRLVVHRQVFQQLDQGRALVPWHALARVDHVVAGQGRQRNGLHVLDAQRCSEFVVCLDDAVVHVLVVVHQVHLVDGHHHVLDLQQVGDGGVALGLDQQVHAAVFSQLHFRHVDQDDHGIGGGGAGYHVAGVLFVARGVGDDEFALRGGEIAVGHVDGDALFALGFQAVRQQRQVDGVAHGALMLGARYGCELVGEDAFAVEQQAANQGALAVVDGAGGDEAQQVTFVQVVVQCVHQKYPCFLRFSMEASEVWSSIRVAPRSVIWVTAVSAMIASTSAASEDTGQVQEISPTVRKRTTWVSMLSPSRAGVRSVSGTSRPLRGMTWRSCAK